MCFGDPVGLGHLSNEGPGRGGDPLTPLLGGSRESDPMTLKGVWSSPEKMIELENLMLILELEAPSQSGQPRSDLALNPLGRPGEPAQPRPVLNILANLVGKSSDRTKRIRLVLCDRSRFVRNLHPGSLAVSAFARTSLRCLQHTSPSLPSIF